MVWIAGSIYAEIWFSTISHADRAYAAATFANLVGAADVTTLSAVISITVSVHTCGAAIGQITLTCASAFVAVLVVPAGVVALSAMLWVDSCVEALTGNAFLANDTYAIPVHASEAACRFTLGSTHSTVIVVSIQVHADRTSVGPPGTFNKRMHAASSHAGTSDAWFTNITLVAALAAIFDVGVKIDTLAVAFHHIAYAYTARITARLILAASVIAGATVFFVGTRINTF
jgi:hypothetical protein